MEVVEEKKEERGEKNQKWNSRDYWMRRKKKRMVDRKGKGIHKIEKGRDYWVRRETEREREKKESKNRRWGRKRNLKKKEEEIIE